MGHRRVEGVTGLEEGIIGLEEGFTGLKIKG